jgi:hypothetical protein
MGFEVEIDIGRNGFQHFAGLGSFAVVFRDQFLLKVHFATSFGALQA